MRADAHYVDALMSRSVEYDDRPPMAARSARAQAAARPPAAAPTPLDSLDSLESLESMSSPATSALAAGLLEESLATIMACSTALPSVSSVMARNGVTELIRAEAWRAASLSQAVRVLRGDVVVTRTSILVSEAVEHIVASFGPELRARGVEVETEIVPKRLHATLDRQVLSTVVTQALFLTLSLVEGSTDVHVRVGALVSESSESSESGELSLAITQNSVGVPPGWATRVLDESWTQRAGGDSALVAASAIRAAADLVSGRCQFAGTDRNSRIVVSFPSG
jgi:hypothetical protein